MFQKLANPIIPLLFSMKYMNTNRDEQKSLKDLKDLKDLNQSQLNQYSLCAH